MCKVTMLINTLFVMRTLTDAWKMQFPFQRGLLSREGTNGGGGEEDAGHGTTRSVKSESGSLWGLNVRKVWEAREED